MKKLDLIAAIFLLYGGLNWGLIGFFEIDIVTETGMNSGIARLLDCLVGVSTVYFIVQWKRFKNICK